MRRQRLMKVVVKDWAAGARGERGAGKGVDGRL